METALSKTVVIIGGGFAGLNAAKTLANKPHIKVILLDQRNHHLFQPLLYQVATAGLNPGDIAVPIRAQFTGAENVDVHLSRALAVDLNEKIVRTDNLNFHYDELIVAAGAQHSYFAHPEWEKWAPGLKTLEQASEILRRILLAFEAAENETDVEKQKSLLNFVVIGGGPTGVELAGAIADIARTVLVNNFRRIDPSRARVILLEAGDKILPAFGEKLAERARLDLGHLGVEVRLNSRVSNISASGVYIGEEYIPTISVFWGAGVQATKLDFQPTIETLKDGRIKVEADLALPNHPEVFIAGDMAAIAAKENLFVPGLAPAAIQAGEHAALSILNRMHKKPTTAFVYRDKGQLATIGKHKAVGLIGTYQLSGYTAWLAWLLIHVFYLIGFKNRVAVLLEWAWSYVFSKRGSRLIIDQDWRLHPDKN